MTAAQAAPLDDAAFERLKATANRAAEEAIRELYARMPFESATILFTGKAGKFVAISPEPTVGEDGQWSFMLDFAYDDGSGHIEFTVKQTGWGIMP